MRTFPLLVFLSSLIATPQAHSAVPDLICQELRVVDVDPRSLKVEAYDSRTLYRFKSGQLFLSSPDRGEYLYNKVTQTEPLRFVSGHKTIQFESDVFRTVILVHTYLDDVRVSRGSCTRG
jgi:hypothetical protein